LKENKSITSINLRVNEIGPEGAKYIGESLKENKMITSINLFMNLLLYLKLHSKYIYKKYNDV